MTRSSTFVSARAAGFAAALVVGAWTSPARAEPPAWRVVASVGTDFPVDIGARFDVETPFRLRVSTTLGFMPGAYASSINAILEGLGAYDDAVGNLIEATLQSSFVWRTHVGYRPFSSLGLYGDVGYGLVTLGGSTTSTEIVSAATGATLPSSEAASSHTFSSNVTLQMIDVEIGWTFALVPHWQLRLAVGGAFTVASSTSISPQFTPRSQAAVSAFEQSASSYLNHELESYAMTPVVSVSTGYAF